MRAKLANVGVKLSGDEALAIFEVLARRAETGGRVELRHAGESRALDALEAALEARLTEPFDADYRELIRDALDRLAAADRPVE